MKLFKILLILLILGILLDRYSSSIVKNTFPKDEDVQYFVNDFKNLVKDIIPSNQIDNVKITMGDLESPKAGICRRGIEEINVIIDNYSWKKMDPLTKEQLIFHELGHCVCNLNHEHYLGEYTIGSKSKDSKRGFLDNGCPVSIMHPVLLKYECYQRYKEFYRYELYLRCYSAIYHKK